MTEPHIAAKAPVKLSWKLEKLMPGAPVASLKTSLSATVPMREVNLHRWSLPPRKTKPLICASASIRAISLIATGPIQNSDNFFEFKRHSLCSFKRVPFLFDLSSQEGNIGQG